jgi:hypothetical protein
VLGGDLSDYVKVYYNGSANVPVNRGTYAVTFDLAPSDNWLGLNGIQGGNLEIVKGNPSLNDWDITPKDGLKRDYDGNSVAGVFSAAPKAGVTILGGMTPTFQFRYGTTGSGNLLADTAVKDDGTYLVLMKVPGNNNWNEREFNLTQRAVIDKIFVAADNIRLAPGSGALM